MAKKATEEIITIKPIIKKTMTVIIEGDSDLVLNKMNKRTTEMLTDERNDRSKTVREQNKWEDLATSMHWRDEIPEDAEYDEEFLKDLLTHNAPCISAFGLKKSWGQAVVRNEIDTYATKFDAVCNIIAPGNLVPITFAEHHVYEQLMSPKRGAPVLARHNHFTGWKARITVQFMEGGAYSAEQIVQVINLAGFGIGIGSGRSSGYGRYHVIGVE